MRKITTAAIAAALMGFASLSAAADTVTFGVQAPITGEYANEGQGIAKAVKLLAKQTNADGGLQGKQIKVNVCDDEAKATQAALCARRLANAGVFAVIGSYTSGAASAAQPIYARSNIIQTSDGTADELTQRGFKTFFRNAPPNTAEAKFTGDYLVNGKGYKKVAIISDHSSFAKGLGDATAEAVKSQGGEVIARASINSGSQDFTSVLTDLKSKNPDVIYFSGYYSDGGLLRSQQKQLGMMDIPFVGGDANQNVAFAKIAGDAAEGTIIINVPAPENLPYQAAKDFLAAYDKEYGEAPPSIFTLTNADGMRVIMKAVNETGSMDPDTVMDYMHNKVQKFEGITGPITFDENGERIGSAFQAFEVQSDGKYKTVYPEDAAS